MNSYILTEEDFNTCIQEHILPLCTESSGATIFALVGDLGAGKTTFSKKFLKSIGVMQHVQSPTFSIMQSYPVSFLSYEKVFHLDVYRIEHLNELEVLHIEDVLKNKKHIVLIEWADKVREIIPQDATWIHFEHVDSERREVRIEKGGFKKETQQDN